MSKEYFAKLRAKRKAAGLCTSCGKFPSPCASCGPRNREYMRRKRAGIPQEEKAKSWMTKRDYYLKYKFGITEAQYNEMLIAQGHKCAICGSKDSKDKRVKRLTIDHCHSTGKVRGLLCSACNKCIGMMGESIESLNGAIAYLKKHNGNCFTTCS